MLSGAFRTLEASEQTLSPRLLGTFLTLIEERSLAGDFDTQSLSLTLFSTAHMNFSWECSSSLSDSKEECSFSSLTRVSLRETLTSCAFKFSSKEFYWAIMGLAKLVKKLSSFFRFCS